MSFLGSLFGKKRRVTKKRRAPQKLAAPQKRAVLQKRAVPQKQSTINNHPLEYAIGRIHAQPLPHIAPMFKIPMIVNRHSNKTKKQNYHSTQFHREFVNGEEVLKIQTVSINGKTGFKEVTIQQNGKKTTSKKSLKKKEIKCIQKCQYMPELFSDCEKQCLK
jgi:hypothetical protein